MKKLLFLFFTMASSLPLMSNTLNWAYPPTQISGTNQNATTPVVAIDPSGNVVAGWVENGFLKARAKLHNAGWGNVVNVSSFGASSPSILSDSSGNATAIWLENGVVKSSTLPLGGSWGTTAVLSNSGATSPCIGINSSGDVVAAWARSGSIETSTKLFGGSWQTRVVISSTSAALPAVAVGGTGSNKRAVITWNGLSGSNPVIYSSTRLLSGTWSAQQVISDTGHRAGYSSVAVDLNGNASALWYAYDLFGTIYSNVVVVNANRPSAGSWSVPVAISQRGDRDPSTLTAKLAFDATGNTIALWNNSYNNEMYAIESATLPIFGVWSTPVQLAALNPYAYNPDLAAVTMGNALSAIMFYAGSNLLVQSIESNFSGYMNDNWSVPINISSGSDNGFPRISAASSSTAIKSAAVWVGYNGTNTSVFATTGSRTLVTPPSVLSVVQSVHNFGIFNEYYNTISWTASSDPNVVGYLIYRNGEFLEQTGDVLEYVDLNRVQNGSVTYGVAAVDSSGSSSQIINVNFP